MAEKKKAPKSLRAQLGAPPVNDSLATASWMYRALAIMAEQVLDDERMPQAEKREELLRIADRMAKLQDPHRIYQAEQALRGNDDAMKETTRGPQLTDAPNFSEQARPVAARRGRPPRSAIR